MDEMSMAYFSSESAAAMSEVESEARCGELGRARSTLSDGFRTIAAAELLVNAAAPVRHWHANDAART